MEAITTLNENNYSLSPTQKTVLNIQSVSFNYGFNKILFDISFQAYEGEILCLLGPSGCGKSTLLRLIAGIEELQEGKISIDDTCVAQKGVYFPPEKRNVGLVFQDLGLFPHLTVKKNIAFGLHKFNKKEVNQKVKEILKIVKLDQFENYYPHMLSGGQQQRVALARSLAPTPKVILLDEPFSTLDSTLRHELALEIKSILKLKNMTSIIVTHDHNEAKLLADRILYMDKGRIENIKSNSIS